MLHYRGKAGVFMLHNIDLNQLNKLREHDAEAANIIDTLLDNHKQIISTISHEIRNPLTLVYSRLQMISSQYPETAHFKYWNSTVEDVEFMKQLLEELSTFNNSHALKLSPIDSVTFFKKLILTFAISVEENDLEFISDISPSLPMMLGDAIKLREVFLNILRNANDAISTNGQISFCAIHEHNDSSNDIVVTIRDNGCGIPAKHLESIFEMFTTYKQGGTGLGLAISKNIIEAHGGSIHVSSLPSVGTQITLRLPVQEG